MAFYIQDHSDKFDNIKWDFDESNIPIFFIGKYPYKAFSYKNATILANIRNKIDILCHNIETFRKQWEYTTNNIEYINGVDIFLDIHSEFIYNNISILPNPFYHIAFNKHPTSRYLLSEIPPGTMYDGLNKPKMRYINENLPPVGKDMNGRALYRDIFLNLNKKGKKLDELVIHELAHSMANHINYRPNDHHADFKWAEKLITNYWPW